MSQFVDTGTKSFTNGGTALNRYTRVKLDAGVLAVADADDEDYLGVLRAYSAASVPATVMLRTKQGTIPMIAAGAITAGAEVFAAAAGKVAATGTRSLGHALDAASGDGAILEVLPHKPARMVEAANIADAVALTENSGAIGGTNDGDLPALVDPAGDSGASVIAGIRENATAINTLTTKLNAVIAALEAQGILADS